ncbi:hypothetical protein GOODEAATRI_001612 [Goodea atripinnis]|uniref:Uncharacterized protein n=1 Tax=Goodea atripinnis TaxID=208336 RepID=A0ABV0P0K3_9TELE
MEYVEPGNRKGTASGGDSNKANTPPAPPPKTQVQNNITTRGSLTIYFHAVRKILKEFMLTQVFPQLKDGNEKCLYIQDPMGAAMIMLYVWRHFQIKLDQNADLNRLCSALCLPKLEKDKFIQYWTNFSRDVSVLKK